MVKVLRLSTSIDVMSSADEGERAPALVGARLADAIGEPVETVTKKVWPRQKMPEIIERWIAEFEPDLVLVVVTPYWFAFESVPLQLKVTDSRIKRSVGLFLRRTAETRLLRGSMLLRAVRRAARRSVGGVTYFEPAEVVAAVMAWVEVVRRHPAIALAVYGLPGSNFDPRDRGYHERTHGRLVEVYSAVRTECAELGVACLAEDDEVADDEWGRYTEPDRLHVNAAGHRRLAEHQFPVLLEAWRRHSATKSASAHLPELVSN